MSATAFGKTTAIGSLPHHNVDAAIGYAFQFDVPALPQIPIRHYEEFMIPQALQGLPGLLVDPDGSVVLDVAAWKRGAPALDAALSRAFEIAQFEAFQPTAESSSCWLPFLFEVQERKTALAKVQIAGPLTCQWVLSLSDGTKIESKPELGAQIMRLITAKASALVQRLKNQGTQAVVFLDEPGLYAFAKTNPKHLVAVQELRLLIAALKKQGALAGLHCCSNTDWETVFELGLNMVSFDVDLSLSKILENADDVARFVEKGGTLSLGVIPTNLGSGRRSPTASVEATVVRLRDTFGSRPQVLKQILCYSLLTPACGLALKSIGDTEAILAELKEYQGLWRRCREVL